MVESVLHVTGLDKRFGSVKALEAVDFDLARGEIHALLGVNGAGKSTLVKILSGVYSKDGGRIEVNGRSVTFRSPRDAMAHGVAAVQQHPEQVPGLRGFEHIFLGQEARKPGLFNRYDPEALRARAAALLRRFPVEIDLERSLDDMPAIDREVVAILSALARDDISILILDEPTSVLTARDQTFLFGLIRTLKQVGIAIIYITHRLDEVFEIADRFTVFRAGRNVMTLNAGQAKRAGLSLAEALLGEKSGDLYPPRMPLPKEVLLEARNLGRAGCFRRIDLRARRGEILGIFGLVGSGVDELSKVLFGVSAPTEGTLSVAGKAIRLRGARDALKRGIVLLPGDRRTEGLTMTRDVVFNVTLANLRRASGPLGWIRALATRRDAKALADQVALYPALLTRQARAFSGGNQQKIVIAKALYSQARIYVFVEPTVGVDIGARSKIYALMRALSRDAAVIVMSSDCDEVFGLSDTVMALYKGQVTYTGVTARTDRNALMMAGIAGVVETHEAREAMAV